MVNNKAQMKIMQMIIMILAVFIFFALVGIFLINISATDLQKDYLELQREYTISLIESMVNSPEFVCSSRETWCVDQDKVEIMSGEFGKKYADFWGVSSIEILRVYPNNETKIINCPNSNCNYYKIYQSEQNVTQTYSAYVSMCEKVSGANTNCELVKFILGI